MAYTETQTSINVELEPALLAAGPDATSIYETFVNLEGLHTAKKLLQQMGEAAVSSVDEEIAETADELRMYRSGFPDDFNIARAAYTESRRQRASEEKEQMLNAGSPFSHELLRAQGMEVVEQRVLSIGFGSEAQSDMNADNFPALSPFKKLHTDGASLEATATLISSGDKAAQQVWFVDLLSSVDSLASFSEKQIDKHGSKTREDHDRAIIRKLEGYMLNGQMLSEQTVQGKELHGLKYLQLTTSHNHTRFYYFYGPEVDGVPSIVGIGECNKNDQASFYSLISS